MPDDSRVKHIHTVGLQGARQTAVVVIPEDGNPIVVGPFDRLKTAAKWQNKIQDAMTSAGHDDVAVVCSRVYDPADNLPAKLSALFDA